MLSSGQMTTAASTFLSPLSVAFLQKRPRKQNFAMLMILTRSPACLSLSSVARLPPAFLHFWLSRLATCQIWNCSPPSPSPAPLSAALRPLGGGWRLADCCRLFYCAPNDARKCCRCPSARPPVSARRATTAAPPHFVRPRPSEVRPRPSLFLNLDA